MPFAFSFSGDDLDEDTQPSTIAPPTASVSASVSASASTSAFPIQGRPQLPPTHHPLTSLLATLPSKIAYSTVDVVLDGDGDGDGTAATAHHLHLPRRELWDVRVQLMAEDDGTDGAEAEHGLGTADVKTGVYEGGFKSWESSVELVKVLLQPGRSWSLTNGNGSGLAVVEVCMNDVFWRGISIPLFYGYGLTD